MRTILLLIALVAIAYCANGQSDSVTISLERANIIEKRLTDCDLADVELRELRLAEQQQRIKVMALEGINRLMDDRVADLKRYNAKLEKKIHRMNRRSKWERVGAVALFVAGVFLGSQ